MDSIGQRLDCDVIGTIIADNRPESDEVLSPIGGLATLASVPLFFASSKNKNNAQLIYFRKNIAMASTDSIKRLYLDDAVEYFKSKAKGNTTTAVILSSFGGALIVAGIITASSVDKGYFFSNSFDAVFYALTGISVGLLSIPFYVRAAHLKNTAHMILGTGRLPAPELGNISPVFSAGKYVTIGIRIPL